MLAYQHAYHAGNFADVHKHLALFALTEALMRKASAITFVDTHAGRGHYPLEAPETRQLGEYRDGVLPLWDAAVTDNALLDRWRDALAEAQPGQALKAYPGSPWWLARTLRQQDRLMLYELHSGERQYLETAALSGAGRIRRVHADGLHGLTAMMPVKTPRLCVLIDPAWEVRADYERVPKTLAQVMRRVRHAIVLVWYPLLPEGQHTAMLERLREYGLRKVWRSEFVRHESQGRRGLYGSGLALVNPPWQLPERLSTSYQHLAELYGGSASHRDEWWIGE